MYYSDNNLVKEEALTKVNVKTFSQVLVLIGVATFLPFLIHIQWLTGPIINAVFIIVLFLSGLRSAVIICLIPSMMALAGGLLPLALAPALPFIMISNIIYIFFIDLVYNKTKKVNAYWQSVLAGSFAKLAFLLICARFVIMLVKNPILDKVILTVMGPMQLISALLGGIIAFGVLKWLKRI